MAAYLARITVRDVDDDEQVGMADALRARGSARAASETGSVVVFEVLGEAPDLSAATAAARQHAAEILDGYAFEVNVANLP